MDRANDDPANLQPLLQTETKSMRGISSGFYAVAHEITENMSRLGLHEGGTYRYTASVVILLHSCLEAYINEFLAFHRQLDAAVIEPKLLKLRIAGRASLEKKWLRTPRIFGDVGFDKTSEPFHSFKLLICLRNVLCHYDAKFRTKSEFPSDCVQALSTKFPFSYPGNADWTLQVLNFECARWGCHTVKAMVTKFHEFVKGIDLSSGPYPWPDPP